MVGRRVLRWREKGEPSAETTAAPSFCPLCDRPIPARARQSVHHLTPKLKGGTHGDTVRLHQICHSAIHARYSEAELARRLADVDALRREPAIAGFIAWVRDKPPDFHAATRMTRERRDTKRAKR